MKITKTVSYTFTTLLFLLFPIGSLTVLAEEQKEIDIGTNVEPAPNNYFFNVRNIKPGDWMPRNIEIRNDGKRDFKYTVAAEKVSSVKGLYEQLDLLVKNGETVLFDDKLPKFEGLTPRSLSRGHSETLFFQVSIPYELDNNFQGSAAEVKLIFLAEGINNPGGGGDTPEDDDDTPGGGGNTPGDDGDIPEDDGETPKNGDTPNGDNTPNNGDNSEGEQEDGSTPEEKQIEDANPPTIEPPLENPPSDNVITVTPKMVNKLPNTATNIFNYLLIGSAFIGTGGLLLLYQIIKRRKYFLKKSTKTISY